MQRLISPVYGFPCLQHFCIVIFAACITQSNTRTFLKSWWIVILYSPKSVTICFHAFVYGSWKRTNIDAASRFSSVWISFSATFGMVIFATCPTQSNTRTFLKSRWIVILHRPKSITVCFNTFVYGFWKRTNVDAASHFSSIWISLSATFCIVIFAACPTQSNTRTFLKFRHKIVWHRVGFFSNI